MSKAVVFDESGAARTVRVVKRVERTPQDRTGRPWSPEDDEPPIYITVKIPVADMDDGKYVHLAYFTLDTDRKIYVVRACISDNAGNADAGYDMTVYNVTDSATIYETSSATLQMGTVWSPLNTTEFAEGDQVRITAANNSGSDAWLCGLVTFAVL